MTVRHPPFDHRGFTLVELVMVIVITGILAGMISVFIRKPVEGYLDVSRRAELVDAADAALRMMARDIHQALPNSIRCSPNCNVNSVSGTATGGGTALEMLNAPDGARYRVGGYPAADTSRQLNVHAPDGSFNTIGDFLTISPPVGGAITLPNSDHLAIYNLGTPGYDAYQITAASTSGVMTPPGTSITIANDSANHPGEDQITLNPAWQFGTGSPRQRLFVVSGPISYQLNGTILYRYSNYGIQANMPVPPTGPGMVQAPVTQYVTACHFYYQPGTATRGGVVTIELQLTEGGETVSLLHQVHVDNAP